MKTRSRRDNWAQWSVFKSTDSRRRPVTKIKLRKYFLLQEGRSTRLESLVRNCCLELSFLTSLKFLCLSELFQALTGNLRSGCSSLLKIFSGIIFCYIVILGSFLNVPPVIVVFKFHIQIKKSKQTYLDDMELVKMMPLYKQYCI